MEEEDVPAVLAERVQQMATALQREESNAGKASAELAQLVPLDHEVQVPSHAAARVVANLSDCRSMRSQRLLMHSRSSRRTLRLSAEFTPRQQIIAFRF